MIPKPKKFVTRTNSEWVSDTTESADHSGGPVYTCVEKRCEPLPKHAHSKRPYLMWSKEKFK
jgi:hypothetical protein